MLKYISIANDISINKIIIVIEIHNLRFDLILKNFDIVKYDIIHNDIRNKNANSIVNIY